jgi:pimeloyl-ACP methyl ester carboxylesterase
MLTSDYAGSFDGTLIHYKVNRRESNPALLFIHGAGSNHTEWSRLSTFLGEKSWVAVDLRNHGLSGFGKQSIESDVRDVAEIIARENLTKFIPVGMGSGAIVALELAKRFKSKVPKVVLISPSSKSLTKFNDLGSKIAKTIHMFSTGVPRRQKLKFVHHDEVRKTPSILRPFQELGGIHLRDYSSSVAASLNNEFDFANFKKPILIITGDKDQIIRKHSLTKHLRKFGHLVHCEVPGDHSVLNFQPWRTARLISFFTK